MNKSGGFATKSVEIIDNTNDKYIDTQTPYVDLRDDFINLIYKEKSTGRMTAKYEIIYNNMSSQIQDYHYKSNQAKEFMKGSVYNWDEKHLRYMHSYIFKFDDDMRFFASRNQDLFYSYEFGKGGHFVYHF
jgi:hypothetical protein